MLNRSGGVISHYDHHFRRYAPLARWDWRLLAAQCYQNQRSIRKPGRGQALVV